jgi:hypothetical protein
MPTRAVMVALPYRNGGGPGNRGLPPEARGRVPGPDASPGDPTPPPSLLNVTPSDVALGLLPTPTQRGVEGTTRQCANRGTWAEEDPRLFANDGPYALIFRQSDVSWRGPWKKRILSAPDWWIHPVPARVPGLPAGPHPHPHSFSGAEAPLCQKLG